MIGILISAAALSFGTDILDLPKGAESIALGNTGAAFSNEPNSVILNPANGAFYGARSGLNVWGSSASASTFRIGRFKSNTVGCYTGKGDWGASASVSLNSLKYGTSDYFSAGKYSETLGIVSVSAQWKKYIALGISLK